MIELKLRDSERPFRSRNKQTTDSVFCYEYNPPIPIELPLEKQVKLLYDGILIDCNLACVKSYGFDRFEDVINQNLIDLFGTTSDSLDNLFRDLIDNDYDIVDRVSIEKLPNGEERYFLNNSHGVIENDKLLRVWGTYRDISEHIKSGKKLRESEQTKVEKKLKELSKLKSELLTRTSHELKTPVMHIKGYANILLNKYKKNLGIDELQIISHIMKGVLRLETLIYDILHKAELDSGHGELNKVKNNLASLVDLSIRELKSFAMLRRHSITVDIDNNLIISFDKDQIRHVINNLITNAIKYTPLNGIIGINSTMTDDFITIAIQDNGIGFTEEQINRLFTQFGKIERYGQGFDIITEGSGLGLSIAKKIIDLHGGRIWVESGGRNKGSTFYFSLPRN